MNDKISICITNKNRSKVITQNSILYLLPDCVESIHNIIEDNDVELIISDWGSTDWPIREWIKDKAPDIPIKIINIECKEGFSAGAGRNIASNYAKGNMLFFIDADMILDRYSFYEAYIKTKDKGVCFPKIKYQLGYNSSKCKLHTGAGNVLITKELFEKTEKWPEYWTYGYEDIEFAKNIKKLIGTLPFTDTPLFHQWHPGKLGWTETIEPETQKLNVKYKTETNKEVEILKAFAKININDPNTTHSKLNHKGMK